MPIDTLCFLNHRCVNVQLLTLKDTILPRRIKYSFVQLYNVAFELPRIMKPCDRDELFCVQTDCPMGGTRRDKTNILINDIRRHIGGVINILINDIRQS